MFFLRLRLLCKSFFGVDLQKNYHETNFICNYIGFIAFGYFQ